MEKYSCALMKRGRVQAPDPSGGLSRKTMRKMLGV